MVKRKKPASCIVDDEKRENEGSLQKNNLDGESMEISNDAQTSVPVPVNPSKSRVHVTRTCTKEVQNIISDCVETENNISPSEKCQKTVPVSKNQRSSNRATKRIRKELNPGEPNIKKTVVTLKQNAPLRSKTRRPWELWSVEDKNAFFEALCEYGKDFESIQSFIAQRSKKKGTPTNMIKNKDQVRHFYYRTWHKISKVLEISDDVRKQTQELYGLINYAELRRKIGACLDEKNSQKLNELVFNGVTTVKYKGKKLRIKTPVCRVLKKLNQVPENEPEVEKLPKEVVLEFKPLSNKDWLYVQNLAQNPRVRTKVTLQHRLKTVIEYLQKRWKPYRLKKKEQILSSLTHFDSSIFREDHTPLLRLKPQNLSAVSTITISALDSASSSDVCLEKHLKISRDCSADAVKTKKNNKLKPKAQSDIIADIRGRDEQISAAKSADGLNTEVLIKDYDKICLDDNYNISVLTPPTSAPDDECRDDPVDEVQRSLSLLTSMLNSVDKSCIPQKLSPEKTDLQYFKKPFIQGSAKFNSFEEMYLKNCQEGEQLTLGQLLGQSKSKSPVSSQCDDEKNESDVEKDSSSFNFHAVENEDEKSENYGENDANSSNFHAAKKDDSPLLDVMKKGWTVDTVGLLTVGELYLMLGRPEKISLTYEFEEQKLDENCKETSSEVIKKKEETDVLRKLLQQAALSFTDYRNKQATPSASVKSSSNTRVNASHSAAKTSSRCVSKNSTVKSAMKSKSSVSSKLPSAVRNSSHTRVNTSLSPIKASSCYGSNNSTTKTANVSKSSDSSKLNQDSVTSSIAVSSQVTNQKTITEAAQCSTSNSVRTVCSDLMSSTPSDKHVFVVPVGTAPRTVKKPTQESLKEEISKLLPGNRRGCRVRRKPLVVQRPLLPRDRIGTVSGPRSMTLVHFVPSGSQLTAVIPSNATGAESKANMLPAKKVVKILSTGTAIDMRPIQVPLMKQMNTDASTGVILQPSAIPTAHLMVTSPVVQNISHQTLSSVINKSSSNLDSLVNLSETTKLISSTASTQSTVSGINSVAISLPSHAIQSLTSASECSSGICDSLISSSPPQISIPDTQCSSSDLSSGHVPSFLEISLPDSLSAKNPESSNSSLLDFSDSSSLCAFGISSSSSSAKLESEDLSSTLPSCLSSDPSVTSTESSTPSRNLQNRLFRISSPGPEAQWLNGEGAEFSFSSLLNTLESPSKVLSLSSSASNVGSENSNLDPIARLAPVMDSQVRCLLEECSVDFITKFEDLADEINSPSMDSKQT